MDPRRLSVFCVSCLCMGLILSCSSDESICPDTTSPTVTLTFPAAGDTLVQDTTFTAQAGDNVGVVSVTFWIDGLATETDSQFPYEMRWLLPAFKQQTSIQVQVSALDAAGNEALSEATTVAIGVPPDLEAPSVSITSPIDGAELSDDVTISLTADDNIGVSFVTFLIDRAEVGVDSLPPYEYDWDINPVAEAGDHVLSARATDAAQNVGTSESLEVTVVVPDDVNLLDAIAAAGPGTHNDYEFDTLVDLDPLKRYFVAGEVVIGTDICIRGHSATIDFERNGYILVIPPLFELVRFDIEYCLLLHGVRPTDDEISLGGAIEYYPDSEGWVKNNTFYDNAPAAIYVHQTNSSRDIQIKNNVLYQNIRGIIRYEANVDLAIQYNNSAASTIGPDFGMHCGCPEDNNATEILPGTEELHGSNFSLNPGFVENPQPPRIPGDFHLLAESLCRFAGENGEDIGAFPYEE